MASSPRFPLPEITRKDQKLFQEFTQFSQRSPFHPSSDSGSEYEHQMDMLLTAAITSSNCDDTGQLNMNKATASDSGISTSEESKAEMGEAKLPHGGKGISGKNIILQKRAIAPKSGISRTRTRARKDMDLDMKQVGNAEADSDEVEREEEGGEEEEEEEKEKEEEVKDVEQAKRKREVDESDEEETVKKVDEKKEEEEEAGEDDDDGSDASGFKILKAKLAQSPPAKKRQKKPQGESLIPPSTLKKAKGRASKGSKAKNTDEDTNRENDREKSSEELEGEKSGKENEEAEEEEEETSTGKGTGKGRKKKTVAAPKKPRTKRAPKAKKATREPPSSEDASEKKSNGGQGGSAITKVEAGLIFDMSITDAKWSVICETLNEKFGTKRLSRNVKQHCITKMRDRVMNGYPDH